MPSFKDSFIKFLEEKGMTYKEWREQNKKGRTNG